MERIGDSWNRIYIPQWRKPRVAQEQSFRGEGGGFLSPTPNTRTPDQITFLFCFHRDTRLSATIYTYSRDPPVIPAPSLQLVEKRTILPFQFPSTYFLSRTFFHFPLFFVLSRGSIYFSFQLGDREKVLARNGFDYFLTFLPC